MAKEFGKFPHEVINLDLADWSFNLFCLNEEAKLNEENKGECSKEAEKFLPKDKITLDKLNEMSNKLPMWGLDNAK